MVLIAVGCAAGPAPRVLGDSSPSIVRGRGLGDAPNHLDFIVGYPSGDPPCSTLHARVNGGEYLELGQFCGHIEENREATGSILNLRGYRDLGGQELQWEFRAVPTREALVFQRRNEGSDWEDIASVAVIASSGWVTEIQWPSDTWPIG